MSPAFDLLPDTANRREHVLHFNPDFHFPEYKRLVDLGRQAQIAGSAKIVEEIRSALSDWKEVYRRWSVSKADVQRLSYSIESRLE